MWDLSASWRGAAVSSPGRRVGGGCFISRLIEASNSASGRWMQHADTSVSCITHCKGITTPTADGSAVKTLDDYSTDYSAGRPPTFNSEFGLSSAIGMRATQTIWSLTILGVMQNMEMGAKECSNLNQRHH